jgi:ABC-type sugar transport system substrate-binding protein
MKRAKGVVLKTAMVFLASVVVIAAAGVFPAMGGSKQEVAEEMEFKNGKTVWLLMPYTGEYWWNMLVTFLGREVEADGWNFNFTTAEGSDTTQFEQITTYAQQADIIFVNPTTMTAINEAVRIAEEQYHTPVVIYKDHITGAARVCVEYSDFEAAQAMAKEAVEWIQDKYGSTRGKTVIALNGDLRLSGWKLRADGFRWIKENHPEINFIEVNGGMTPEGWADVAEATIGGAGKDAVALLAASDGAYLLGALSALEKYGKLYYAGDPNHMYVASIDGKPSTLTWLRRGYIDVVYSQTPDSIAASLWRIAKDHIVKDPSYQYSPYDAPQVPLPLKVQQPEGCYWGGKDLVMTVKKVEYSETPMGKTPSPRVDRNNVNLWDLWGNSIVQMIGEDLDPVPTFKAKGKEPEWSKKLMSEFNSWAGK